MAQMDPNRDKKDAAEKQANKVTQSLARSLWVLLPWDEDIFRIELASNLASNGLALKVLKRLEAKNIELTEYENIVAADVADPADLSTVWEDVGGLDTTIQTLKVNVEFMKFYVVSFEWLTMCKRCHSYLL